MKRGDYFHATFAHYWKQVLIFEEIKKINKSNHVKLVQIPDAHCMYRVILTMCFNSNS